MDVLLLLLCASCLLMYDATDAVGHLGQRQSANLSSSNGTDKEIVLYNNTNLSDGDSTVDTQPQELHSLEGNAVGTKCPIDFCEIWNLCEEDEICMTKPPPDCGNRCVKNGFMDFGTTSTGGSSTSGDKHGTSPHSSGFECNHGVADNINGTSFTCMCDDGWIGTVCNQQCNLTCIHGQCGILENKMHCACEKQYIGKICDEMIPDPIERSRILAGVLSSALVVAVLLIIIIPIIMWRLRVILILKLIYIFQEFEDEDGKEFDAYISMTSTANTEHFVYGSLQPILENENFKLYLQARDAPAGEVMSETILSALEKSRRTIMVITPDYITNEWSRFEYLIAQHEALKLHQKIIPIILEDIDKEVVEMDKSLKHILDSVKCLKFPQVKSKSETSSHADILDGIQSPDSNKSVDSITYFTMDERFARIASVSKKENKFQKKVDKFWKRLILTMPKKKIQKENSIGILVKLKKHSKYEINTNNCEDMTKNVKGNMQEISEFNFKINFTNDSKSVDPMNGEDIIELSSKEIKCNNDSSLLTVQQSYTLV